MNALSDESVDLVVTSPPYPCIAMWDAVFTAMDPAVGAALEREDGPAAFELMHRQLDAVWRECFRVLRPGSFLCINIGDATRSFGSTFRIYTSHARITVFCESLGFQSLPAVLWRKQTNAPNKFMGSGMLPAGAYVTLEHEHILVFRKGEKRGFSAHDRRRRRESAYFWEERNRWFSDVWDFKGTRQDLPAAAFPDPDIRSVRARSGSFPLELAYRLVCMFSVQGDTVLDPFLGTGTTALACLAGPRSSIGYEIDRELEPVIERRILSGRHPADRAVERRLSDHLRFIEHRLAERGLAPAHRSAVYGFPVITGQETDLTLYRVESVRRSADGSFIATHILCMPGDGEKAGEALPPAAAAASLPGTSSPQIPLDLE